MESVKAEDLLQSPIFQCKICRKRLSSPIMDVPSIGSICGRCFKQKTYTNAIENIDISSILSKLQIACAYSKQGCSFQGLFSEINIHEDVCRYREKICPFSFINKCSANPVPSIIKHIKTEHLLNVHHYCSNMIKIDFCLEDDFEEFHLLSVNEDDFLLRTKLDTPNNVLIFVIYYFNINAKCHFSIRHENEVLYVKSKNCSMMSEIYLMPSLDPTCGTSFDLSLLKRCLNKTVTTVIEICGPSFQIANNKLLKFMECPVCNEYMTLQIRQCSQGHSICKACRQKLQECPLCKSSFGAARNYTLESITSLIQFPCRNSGCKEHTNGDEIEKHELECRFKNYQCPFLIKLNCKWKGLHKNITEHLITEHSDFTEFTNFVKRRISLDYANHKYDTICIILGQHIFKVCVCINGANKLFLTYGIYGPVDESYKFIWETGIYHKNSDKNKFVIKDVCSTYMATNYKLDIEGYAVDDSIYFYHSITSL